jgi:hypothetical protein
MNNLVNTLLFEILDHLDIKSIIKCSKINRLFNNLCADSVLWQHKFNNMDKTNELYGYVNIRTNTIDELDIIIDGTSVIASIASALKTSISIIKLTINGPISDDSINSYIKIFNNIKYTNIKTLCLKSFNIPLYSTSDNNKLFKRTIKYGNEHVITKKRDYRLILSINDALPYLTTFEANNCDIECARINLLSNLTSLKVVNLQDNKLNCCSSIISKILEANYVEELNISQNAIDDRDMEIICKKLKYNTSLKFLDINKCRIHDISYKYLHNALIHNKTFRKLHLSGNMISDFGFDHLIDLIKYNNLEIDDIYNDLFLHTDTIHTINNMKLLINQINKTNNDNTYFIVEHKKINGTFLQNSYL